MYSLTLPLSYIRLSDVCKLIVQLCGEGMDGQYSDNTLWMFLKLVSHCDKVPLIVSLFCLPRFKDLLASV